VVWYDGCVCVYMGAFVCVYACVFLCVWSCVFVRKYSLLLQVEINVFSPSQPEQPQSLHLLYMHSH